MAKKLILSAIIVLGCCVFTFHNDSMATTRDSAASHSGIMVNSRHHRGKPPYRILNSRYVSRSTLRKDVGAGSGVRIKIMQNGSDNTDIEDLLLQYDSGNEYRMGNIYGIENTSFPLYVKVTYRSWNTFHAVQFDVTYEFVVYYPGVWDVTISN